MLVQHLIDGRPVGSRETFQTVNPATQDVLAEIASTVRAGIIAVDGRSGAGKSTLFSIILGEEQPIEGTVERDAWTMVGYLPQEGEAVGEETVLDYAATGLSLRRHPLALLRERLARRGILNATQLAALPHGRTASACGIVTVRQQPQTAKGTIFVTLEDETGPVNVIVWKHVREAQRDALLRSRLLAVRGTWQRDVDSGGQVCHLVAARLVDLTPLLGRLGQQSSKSRDFH